MNLAILIIGYAASIFMIIGYLPQAINALRTGVSEGIMMHTFWLLAIGNLFFIVQGILLGNVPFIVLNVIAMLCTMVIISIKKVSDYRKHLHRL